MNRKQAEEKLKELWSDRFSDDIQTFKNTLNAEYSGLGDLYEAGMYTPAHQFDVDEFHEEAVQHILTCNTKLYKALK